MKLRLIKHNGTMKILCPNGSIMNATNEVLYRLMTSFKSVTAFKGQDGFWSAVNADMNEYPGTTLAMVDEKGFLVVFDEAVFKGVLINSEFISATEFADKHEKCRATVKRMCSEGRIKGAYKTSSGWLIPKDAQYPSRKKREVQK